MTTTGIMHRACLPATLAQVDVACLNFRSLLLGSVPNQQDRFALELLAREAIGNAVRHGCKEDASKRVWFTFRLGRHRVTLRIRDEGPGFDWRVGMVSPVDDEASHGRGLSLFRQYADRCLFGGPGNNLLLVRNLLEAAMSDSPSTPDQATATLQPGDLTASSVESVRTTLKALLKGGAQHLVIDLGGVLMIDSTGIGLLIQAHNTLNRQGGTLTVIHASEDIKGLFQSMRLDQRFNLQD